jgi:ribosome-binding protein aMBF1 (putative translation factor)
VFTFGLDGKERMATVALLAEILFPNADNKGFPGLDLEEAEEIAGETSPDAKETLARMDGEEATFAAALRRLLEQKGLTQEKLAEKVGIGQPAISMMPQRKCRPQKRTLARLADALDVSAEELWPTAQTRGTPTAVVKDQEK